MRAFKRIPLIALLFAACNGNGLVLGLGPQCASPEGALRCGEACLEPGAVCQPEVGNDRAICKGGVWQCASTPSSTGIEKNGQGAVAGANGGTLGGSGAAGSGGAAVSGGPSAGGAPAAAGGATGTSEDPLGGAKATGGGAGASGSGNPVTGGGCRATKPKEGAGQCSLFLGDPPLPGFPGGLAGVAIGDLNCDGYPDVAGTMPELHALSVVFGRGDGTFGQHVDYAAASTPGQLRIADLDGDEDNDIVVANPDDDTLSVFLNLGDGTLAPRTDYPTGSIVWWDTEVAVGDANGDGNADLATPGGGAVSLLLGKGDGTFGAKTEYAVTTNDMSLAFGDLNRDGREDLVVSGDVTSVLFGATDGTLNRPIEYPEASYYVRVGDLNGDGNLDISTGTEGTLLNRGDGSLDKVAESGAPDHDFIFDLGDLNGDGMLDLAMLTGDEDGDLPFIRIVLGHGDGSFGEEVWHPSPAFLESLDIGDLNGDGRNDVLVNSGPVALFSPDFGTKSGGSNSLVQADINGDGILDIATITTTDNEGSEVSVLTNRGDGSYATTVVHKDEEWLTDLSVGDTNGDGITDLIMRLGTRQSLLILRGNGDGTFPTHTEPFLGNPSGGPTFADYNGDTLVDYAATGIQPDTLTVSFSQGDGTFSSPVVVAPADWSWSMAAGDLNSDGNIDLIATDRMQIGVLLAEGGGTFAERSSIPTPGMPEHVVVSDLNGDNILDLAIADSVDAGDHSDVFLEVALGVGDGTFGPWKRTFPAQWEVTHLAVGDLNSDGRPDLITQLYSDFRVFLNNGDGSFASGPKFAGQGSSPSILMDYNGDGRVDLVDTIGDGDTVRLSVRLNQCQ